MNIFLHELKAYRKSTIIWICSLTAITALFLSMYPGFSKDISSVKELISAYPEALIKAFGVSMDKFSSVIGFYSYTFLYIMLSGAIQASNLGLSIISKENRAKTSDFLLTKPVPRGKVLAAKIFAVITLLLITNAAYISLSYVIITLLNSTFSAKIFIMISITMFFVQLMFAALGILISEVVPKIKSVVSVSLSIVFGIFFINMFDSVVNDKTLRYLTPFKYYDADYIIKNASYEPSFVIVEILFLISVAIASFIIFSKKDIHAV